MILGASVWYLLATLAVVGLARWRGGVVYDCAVVLLIWFSMANLAYAPGQIETLPTLVAGVVYMVLCVVLVARHDQHWLPLYLFFAGFSMVCWNAFYAGDPYVYKAVKNGIYLSELIAVGATALWTKGRTQNSSDGSQVDL